MSESSPPRNVKGRTCCGIPWPYWAAGLIALAVAAVLMAWWWKWAPRPRPEKPSLSIQEKLVILEETRRAVGLLENETELQTASQIFAGLAEKVPGERLPWQNRAIAELLQIKQNEQIDQAKLQQAQQAVEQLLEKFPSAEAYWLAAQFIGRLPRINETERAQKIVELLEEAQKADPQSPVYPMGIYEALSAGAVANSDVKMREALRAAYQKAPDNLHVLVEWLTAQAEGQDATISETLRAARQVLAPLWRSILGGDNLSRDDAVSSLGRNVLELIDEALAALQAGNWQQVRVLSLQIRNGVGPLIVHRNDAARISPHPLAFVVQDYSAAFYKDMPPPGDDIVHVQFKATEPLPLDGLPKETSVVDTVLADFDLDRQDDWIVLLDNQLRVYQGQPGRPPGKLIASVELPQGMRGVLIGDLDNDHLATRPGRSETGQPQEQTPHWHEADLDLVVFGAAGIVVLENRLNDQGQRELLVRQQSEVAEIPRDVHAAILVDFDHDADLDLVIATAESLRCWSGRGNATFEDLTAYSVLPENVSVRRIVPVDWDRDGDIDLVCSNRAGQALLLENRLHGHLTWKTIPVKGVSAAADVAVADLDGNASWDLVLASSSGLYVQWTYPAGGAGIRLGEVAKLSDEAFERVLVADFDNNGYGDVVAWNGSRLRLFRGAPRRQWSSWDALAVPIRPAYLRAFDVDRDGDLDLASIQDGQLAWLRNDGGNTNHWLQFRLVGQCDNKGCSGHTGIGSLIEIKAGNHYQAQVVVSDSTHFGLAGHSQADVARIVWTNGVPQTILQPAANQYLTELMTLKGSCPYLYTWNGEKFVFVTDCLWAAPLGMQVARGVLAPCRPWEYLKIDGKLLQPRNGYYELQLTEELWEAAYFDQVELLAIDHPSEVEIFSNEKVGPAEIAAYYIHTVRNPRRPRAARDQRGRDILHLIAEEDDKYAAPWDRKLAQGLTEQHYVELDLGKLDNPKRILLFLTGWIYPANTSLNVAFSANPVLEAPRPPAIWTPDAAGQWREVLPFMGFPGGKTKTIVVDVSNLFTPGDYRLRIVTTAEIYWDGAFFTVDEEPAPLTVQRLGVAEAHLHYRGFSERVPYQNNRPERYLYERVDSSPRWPSMRGKFTRYGDVTPLLAAQDNHLAVLGAGDELTVRFAVPPREPPGGWKRDFFLYCVGWDKDADLNTICGQSVEPLPYHGMTEYPYDPGAGPNDDGYRHYLQQYQTREQVPARFWQQIRYWPAP